MERSHTCMTMHTSNIMQYGIGNWGTCMWWGPDQGNSPHRLWDYVDTQQLLYCLQSLEVVHPCTGTSRAGYWLNFDLWPADTTCTISPTCTFINSYYYLYHNVCKSDYKLHYFTCKCEHRLCPTREHQHNVAMQLGINRWPLTLSYHSGLTSAYLLRWVQSPPVSPLRCREPLLGDQTE